jgi:hypothetical protein
VSRSWAGRVGPLRHWAEVTSSPGRRPTVPAERGGVPEPALKAPPPARKAPPPGQPGSARRPRPRPWAAAPGPHPALGAGSRRPGSRGSAHAQAPARGKVTHSPGKTRPSSGPASRVLPAGRGSSVGRGRELKEVPPLPRHRRLVRRGPPGPVLKGRAGEGLDTLRPPHLSPGF